MTLFVITDSGTKHIVEADNTLAALARFLEAMGGDPVFNKTRADVRIETVGLELVGPE